MKRDSGQAAVESALTLPLTVFLMLGMLQLFQVLQARVLAEYAVFRAVRVGSTNGAKCGPMMDAALLVLLPSFRTFLGNNNRSGTPGEQLAEEFRKHAAAGTNYNYDDAYTDGGKSLRFTRSIMLMEKRLSIPFNAIREQQEFDQPAGPDGPQRLRVTLVFWYPMRIPFANWVISKMVTGYGAVNPLLPTQTARWNGTNLGGHMATVQARAAAGEYVLPVVAEYSMRMMSPVEDPGSCGGS